MINNNVRERGAIELKLGPCGVCRREEGFYIVLEQHYISVLGLPVLPTGKVVTSICKGCTARRTLKHGSVEMNDSEVASFVRTASDYNMFRFWYGAVIWGLLLGLAIIALTLNSIRQGEFG